jgi:medium-chain acyl-[acyl-carrier-protein] hydrolase
MAAKSMEWVVCPKLNPSAELRLVCFPFAGAGISAFSGWHHHLPPEIQVEYVVLPGRDGRRHEPAAGNLQALVQALATGLTRPDDPPIAFFGHSMGALIAFEVARELRRRRLREPAHLFVSASRAPQLRLLNPGECPLSCLSDEAFLRELQRRYGPQPELADPELAELFLPLLRADLSLCEGYRYESELPLASSIVAFAGADDPRVKRHHLEGWRTQTAGAFALVTFPGGHFYLRSDPHPLLRALSSQLASTARRAPVRHA